MDRIASKYRFFHIVLLLCLVTYLLYLWGIVTIEKSPPKRVVDMKEADRDDAVLIAITRDGKFELGGGKYGDEVRVIDAQTEIRVGNASPVELKDVVIDAEKFGDIKPHSMTEYHKSKVVREYPLASVSANSKRLESYSIASGATTDLGPGRFTYVVTIDDSHLYVHAEKDNFSRPSVFLPDRHNP